MFKLPFMLNVAPVATEPSFVTVRVSDKVSVPALTERLLFIVLVPSFANVVVPPPDLVRLWNV